MSTPLEARERLDELASELDDRSKQLSNTERDLEPVQKQYDEIVDDFECACWDRHVSDDEKLPSAALRLKLARRTMDPTLRDRYDSHHAKRARLEKRISSLKAEVDAQRSILSALKVEMEAVG